MKFVEVKCFMVTPESKAWLKLNEDEVEPLDLLKTIPLTIDIDSLVSIRPHTDERATVIELRHADTFTIPMKYDAFMNFVNLKLKA